MKKLAICVLAFVVLAFSASVIADPVGTGTASAAEGVNWGRAVWTFLNSPMGVSVVVFLLSYVLGKVFTAKPEWKKIADKYRPLIIAAIKKAEKEIPDDSSNKAVARLDLALKYVLEVESGLDKKVLTDAVNAVHAEAERDRNI